LDPSVTAIVGRNETGKTSILFRLLDQYFYNRTFHQTDVPNLPNHASEAVRFSLVWQTESRDDQRVLQGAFGAEEEIRTITVRFAGATQQDAWWTYDINGKSARPPLQPVDHSLFPRPHYVNVGSPRDSKDRDLLPQTIDARLKDQGTPKPSWLETTYRKPAASMLMNLAGYGGSTRPSIGRGYEEPWPTSAAFVPPRPGPSIDELSQRFSTIGAQITTELRRWWRDPPGAVVGVLVRGSPTENRYTISWEARAPTGLPVHGGGIAWAITFMIEILFAQALAGDGTQQSHFVFDEPGGPLHPAAQRMLIKLLNDFAASSRSQLIYSTHSPFLLDWSFPHRIRLFVRDHQTGCGTIENKPYATRACRSVWDPLRDTIGVTLGDVSAVGDENLFVEGITDQILIAAASDLARKRGEPHLRLPGLSIVPYGSNLLGLAQLLEDATDANSRSVALIDTDRQGRNVEQVCHSKGVPTIRLDGFTAGRTGDAAIEDVVGVDDYIASVNEFYADFDWFGALNADDVRAQQGTRTLGRYLQRYFEDSWGQDFDKVTIATRLASSMEALSEPARERLLALLRKIRELLSPPSTGPD